MAKPKVLLEVSRPICSLIAKSSPGQLAHQETEATFLREWTVDLYFCFSAGSSKVEAMTSPFTVRCISVTSSGRSSTSSTIMWTSG